MTIKNQKKIRIHNQTAVINHCRAIQEKKKTTKIANLHQSRKPGFKLEKFKLFYGEEEDEEDEEDEEGGGES